MTKSKEITVPTTPTGLQEQIASEVAGEVQEAVAQVPPKDEVYKGIQETREHLSARTALNNRAEKEQEEKAGLERFFKLKAASDEAHKRAADISSSTNHPAWEEAFRLYWELNKLIPFLIRQNLHLLEIEDLEVIVKAEEQGQHLNLPLSDICGLGYYGFSKKFGVQIKSINHRIFVYKDDKEIGYVDSEGRLCYETAPNLRTALGWRIATDGGSANLIEFFDLNKATQLILETIRSNGITEETFFGPYMKALERVFVSKHTSRFGSGYSSAATTLWQVATRELGEEHPGYFFLSC